MILKKEGLSGVPDSPQGPIYLWARAGFTHIYTCGWFKRFLWTQPPWHMQYCRERWLKVWMWTKVSVISEPTYNGTAELTGFRPSRTSLSSHQASVRLGKISSQNQPHTAVRKRSSSGLILQPALEAKVSPSWDQFWKGEERPQNVLLL